MEVIMINRTPQIIAAEINSIKNQTRTMILCNSIEIGRRLVEAKSLVQHGEWGKWLETFVEYSQSTAINLMRIYEEYGSNQFSLFGDHTAKSQALGNLSYTQAVALLGLPKEEREEFIKENDVANMSTRELQHVIKERNEALAKLETAQNIAKEKSEEARTLLVEKQKAEADCRTTDQVLRHTQADVKMLLDTLEKERAKSKEKISQLQTSMSETRKKLNEAKASGDDEEIDRLKDELNEFKQKIEELNKQLNEKPIDVSATVEKIPEKVEMELKDLRENQQRNAAIQKYTIYFDSLVKGFKDLLGALAEIKGTDRLAYEKYNSAVIGLINKMLEHL